MRRVRMRDDVRSILFEAKLVVDSMGGLAPMQSASASRDS